mmetsp:Transcript_5093/g.7796  ORF Transcript_5093/g.7796 Transcript_5093/m.7796 type:complete len:97 (+) Transcript_5093:262-552(+)
MYPLMADSGIHKHVQFLHKYNERRYAHISLLRNIHLLFFTYIIAHIYVYINKTKSSYHKSTIVHHLSFPPVHQTHHLPPTTSHPPPLHSNNPHSSS